MDSNNEGSKFKLDCVKPKNSYILMINIINIKIHLVNSAGFLLEKILRGGGHFSKLMGANPCKKGGNFSLG